MAGHSHWAGIKHKKGKTDKQRSRIFSKLSKEITVAAKIGSQDPETNFRLRHAIQMAKNSNMPKNNIERAINRSRFDENINYESIRYEGFGPEKIAVIIETLTDNKNRTVSDIRSTFSKAGGNMAESGAVAWQFQQKGVIVIDVDEDKAEDLAMIAIDAGAEDFETYDGTLHVYSIPTSLMDIRSSLSDNNAAIASTELSMIPSNTIMLESGKAVQTLRLLDTLEDLDDVQKVYSNADFPEDALESFQSG